MKNSKKTIVNRLISVHNHLFDLIRGNTLLILIMFIGLFLRFHKFTDRISLGLDSARDAFVALEGARQWQFPLTGPFISIAPVTTGPWYWTQLIMAKIILGTSYSPWVLIGFYSSFFILIMYLIGKRVKNQKLGLIMAAITAILPVQISNATGLTNPAVIGFYSGVFIYFVLKMLKEPENKMLSLASGLILGITINTHYQTVGLLTLPVSLLVLEKRKYILPFIHFFLGLAVTFIPLLIFELNNHWYNTRGMLNYILYDQYKLPITMNWKIYISRFWPDFLSYSTGGDRLMGYIMIVLIIMVFLKVIINRNLEKYQLVLIASFLVEVVIIRYYRGEKYFGYLSFFHPYIIYFLAFSFYQLFTNRMTWFLGIILGGYYLWSVIPAVKAVQNPDNLNIDILNWKKEIIRRWGVGPYKLYACQKLLKPEVNAMVLILYMDNKYSDNGRPLIYYWGCQYPEILKNGNIVKAPVNVIENTDFPGVDRFRDASLASESAILAQGFRLIQPEDMYRSAARWWFEEKP